MSEMIKINLEKEFQWSEKRMVQTKRGPMYLRKAPLNEKMVKLCKKYPKEFYRVGISLNTFRGKTDFSWWLPIEKNELERTAKVEQKLTIDRKLKCVDGLDYLNYQKEAICYGLKRKAVLLGDDMGLGKTIQAIGIMNNTPNWKSAIIVCPKILLTNWKRELETWLIKKDVKIVVGDFKPKTVEELGDIFIVNYEKLASIKEVIAKKTFDFAIEDEAHNIKTYKAQRSKNTKKIKWSKKLIRITGTPFLNKPIELHNLINDMDPYFANWKKYAYRYCNGHNGTYGFDPTGSSNLEELQMILYDTIMVRRLKSEVLDLPEKQRQTIYLKPNREQIKALKELNMIDVNYNELFKNPEFSEYAKIFHQISITKVPQIIEYVDEVLKENPDKKLVIGAIHHDVEDMLLEGLKKYQPSILNGATKDKQAVIDRFQNEKENQVIICGIKAAGIGVTLTAADWLIFAELYFTPGIMNQFEDRIYRIGQRNQVLIQQFVLEGSLDEEIILKLIKKQEIFERALNISSKPKETVKQAISNNEEHILTIKTIKDEAKGKNELIHKCLKILSGYDDDHAAQLNGVGFNKIDSNFGNSLAKCESLTDKQAQAALKMCKKYWRQLPKEIVKEIWG